MINGAPKQQQKEITELPFTDLLMKLDSGPMLARFRPDPTRLTNAGNYPVPRAFNEDLFEVREVLMGLNDHNGTITFKGLRLRYSIFIAAEQEKWAAIRAVTLDLPDLDSLRLHPDLVRMVRGWGAKKGLILVGGKTGDGKTTTSVATLKDYLERLGGFLFTLEDPADYLMQGALSEKGFCLQYEVQDDSEWGECVKGAMRRRPDYIFIGEVRTSEAAEHLLKAVTSGHLVITTIHAGSVASTISALLHLAENKLGEVARHIIADRLIGIIHQTLTIKGPRVQVISPDMNTEIADMMVRIIKSGDIAHLDKNVRTFDPTG